jgi:hypothetical protein
VLRGGGGGRPPWAPVVGGGNPGAGGGPPPPPPPFPPCRYPTRVIMLLNVLAGALQGVGPRRVRRRQQPVAQPVEGAQQAAALLRKGRAQRDRG